MNGHSPETHVVVDNRALMTAVRQGCDAPTETVDVLVVTEKQTPAHPELPVDRLQPGPLRRIYELVTNHPLGLFSELSHVADGTCDFKDQE